MSRTITVSDFESSQDLWNGNLTFETGEEVMGFIVLTLHSAEPNSRLSSLEGLHFCTGALIWSVADMLKAFVLRFSLVMNITYLTIDYAEEFFGSSLGLAEVFAVLRTIKHVKIHDVGIQGGLFFRRTRSSFVSVDLTMAAAFDEHPRCLGSPLSAHRRVTARDPITFLHGSRDDLEIFSGSGCRTACLDSDGCRQVYNRVHTLDLQDNDLPDTMHYARTFPNLSNLRFETAAEVLSALHVSTSNSLASVRLRNRAQQLETGTWTSLDACYAPLLDHFMLCVLCPVQEIHVFGPYMNPDMLFQVIKTTLPSTLSLRGFVVGDLATARLAKLLRQPCTSGLKRLELFICVQSSDVDAAEDLDKMVSILHPLRITSMSLSISCFFPKGPESGGQSSKGRNSTDTVREHFESLSLGALAARIKGVVPSLKSMSITLEGHPDRPRTMFVIGAKEDPLVGHDTRICSSSVLPAA